MMKKKWIAGIIIYAVLVAACLIVVYAVPSLRGMLEKTYVTEYGKIDITDEVSAFIVRDETVYVAAQDSEISRVAEPDTLIKAGSRIVELTPIVDEEAAAAGEAGPDADPAEAEAAAAANGEAPDNIDRKYTKVMEYLGGEVTPTEDGRSTEAGYISYFVDGAEAKFSTDRFADLLKEDYESLKDYKAVDTPDRKCGKGEPIFKITDNSRWYLVFYIDNKAGEKYYEGRTVSVNIADTSVPVRVAEVQAGKTTTRVTLSCKKYFEGFPSERTLKTTVTVASAEGLVLQDSSIVMKGEQPGVFVKNKLGEHRFKPISVKADDGERCVVYSDIFVDEGGNYVETLKTYDEIVAEPSEEEIAELQEQAAAEAAEKAKKEAAEKAAKEAAEKAAAEQAAREAEAAAAAKAQAEAEAAQAAAQQNAQAAQDPAAAQQTPEAAATPEAAPAEPDAAAAEDPGIPADQDPYNEDIRPEEIVEQ